MRMRPGLLAAVLAVLLAAPAAASTIVYECAGNICAVDAGGGKERRLTTDGVYGGKYYETPQLSPDGRFMTFRYGGAGGRAYLADRRARRRRPLPRPDRFGVPHTAFIGPGGREAFFFHGTVRTRVCRIALPAARSPRCGRPLPALDRAFWGWGPRGTLLAYDESTRTELCALTLNGRCTRVFTRLREGTFFHPPATSPDGRFVAIAVDYGEDTRITLFDGRTGRRVRDLTRGHTDYPPAWSPDGRNVVFRRDAVVENGVVADICVVGRGGGRVRCLVKRGRELGWPSWGG
jgi:hypothetical protein